MPWLRWVWTGIPALAVYKIGMTWPLEGEGLRKFARGRKMLLVVEEKRSFVEQQILAALYNMPADQRPAVMGKAALDGSPLLPAVMELSPELVDARAGPRAAAIRHRHPGAAPGGGA